MSTEQEFGYDAVRRSEERAVPEGAQAITVLVLNNAGGGFADRVRYPGGTTIEACLNDVVRGDASKVSVKVNSEIVSSEYVLQDEDRVSITPLKQVGGR